MYQILIDPKQPTVGQHVCLDRRTHQQQAAGGLTMDKLLERGEYFVEGFLSRGVKNTFFRRVY